MTVRHLAVPFYTVPAAAGAIAFRALANTTYASRANTAITAPAGIVNGDQLLFSMITGSSGTPPTPTPPAGVTQIGSTTSVTQSGFTVKFSIFRKTASSESGSYTFTHTSCSSQGVALCYSGVHTTTPEDATATSNLLETGPTGQTTVATGITTVTDGAMLVMFEHDFGDIAPASTPPTGMTERLDASITYVADVIQATAGASGNKSHTNSNDGGGDPWVAFLVALRPA